jgi:hypothetical protein
VIVRFKRPKRFRKTPWLAVVIFIAAIAGYGSFEFLPSEISSLIPGNPTSANEEERAAFHLCVRAEQQTCVVDGDTIRYRWTHIAPLRAIRQLIVIHVRRRRLPRGWRDRRSSDY